MLTKILAGAEVEGLLQGNGLFKPSLNPYENFRQGVGIKDKSLLPDEKIAAILENANRVRGPNPLKYSNVFGFYVQTASVRVVFYAVAKLGGTINAYSVEKHTFTSAESKTRFQQMTTYFSNVLKTEVLSIEQKKQVQVALQCIEHGKFDAAMDTYFEMKWIDIRMRVALVHIMYFAQDINIMSVRIDHDARTGKERVFGMRPIDKKICEFIFNAQAPALSKWTAGPR